MAKTVLILGASGKIGRHSSMAFARAGWQVRKYDRKSGDMVRAAAGVDVIVNGLNPPKYHDWANLVPAITREVIAAAKASGATVIIPGNIYNFGNVGGTLSETTPQRPTTKKGQIRVEMERMYAASGVRTLILRAGNFIDPERTDDVMTLLFLRPIAQGKLMVAGDPSALQAYCYLPDWAAAAVALAEKRAELALFEDVPFAGHSFTAEQLREQLSRKLGKPLTFTNLPWWIFQLASPFWELARETLEMRYLWNMSHSISGEKLARLLPQFRPTDLQTVMCAGLPPALLKQTARAASELRAAT